MENRIPPFSAAKYQRKISTKIHPSKISFAADVNAPSNGHRGNITIKNYHHVDNILTRGAKPTETQLNELKRHNYDIIISFCTNYNPNKPKAKPQMPDEAVWAKKLGMKFYWMPFVSTENPKQEYINKFFQITDDARLNNKRVFIHCRHGADRTGLFAAIYKIRNYNTSLHEVLAELLKYGHNAAENKNIIPFIAEFKSNNGVLGYNPKGPALRLAVKAKEILTKLKSR